MRRAAVAALLALGLAGCQSDPCRTETISRVRSPSGGQDAVLVLRTCAGSPAASEVVLARAGREPGRKPVFAAHDNGGRARGGAWDGPLIAVTWDSDTMLAVRFVDGAAVLTREERAGPVQIRYREEPSPAAQ